MNRCEGGSEGAPTNFDITDLRNFPDSIFEDILFRLGFDVTEQAAKDRQKSSVAAKKIFEDRIIHICPMSWKSDETNEDALDGDIYLSIYGCDKILSLFKNFGQFIN